MKAPVDVTALVLGLIALLLAALGLLESFGTINWTIIGLIAPLTLVVIGLLGLAWSRPKP